MDWAIMDCFRNFVSYKHWHIRWKLGAIANEKRIRSRVFETTMGNNDNKLVLKWFIQVSIRTGEIDLTISQAEPREPIAAVARFAISYGNKETTYSDSFVHAFNSRWTTADASLSPSAAGSQIEKGAIIHCWLDFSGAVPHVTELERRKRKWDSYFYDRYTVRCGPEEVPEDMQKLYWSATGGVDDGKDDDDDVETLQPLSDVTLAALDKNGEEVRFFCHRAILAVRSPVFLRMFANKEWKENTNQSERVVVIEDIDNFTMSDVLRYIYSGELVENFECCSEDDLYKIIYAAEKYELSKLKEYLEADLIRAHGSDSSLIKQLELAETYNLKRLHSVCIAALSTKLEQFSTVQEDGSRGLPEKFLSDVMAMAAKRLLDTKEVVVSTHK